MQLHLFFLLLFSQFFKGWPSLLWNLASYTPRACLCFLNSFSHLINNCTIVQWMGKDHKSSVSLKDCSSLTMERSWLHLGQATHLPLFFSPRVGVAHPDRHVDHPFILSCHSYQHYQHHLPPNAQPHFNPILTIWCLPTDRQTCVNQSETINSIWSVDQQEHKHSGLYSITSTL